MEKGLKKLASAEILEMYNKISDFVEFLKNEIKQNEEESGD